MHANIELRTVYLNRMVLKEIEWVRAQCKPKRLQCVVLGGGYDARSIRLLYNGSIDRAWEWDLPVVVASKHCLWRRLLSSFSSLLLPLLHRYHLREVDLNKLEQVKRAVEELKADQEDVYTIYLVEAVFLYLSDEAPSKLLRFLAEHSSNASLLFADCLPDLRKTTRKIDVDEWLDLRGWKLIDFLSKPGATRHMAVARLDGNQLSIPVPA